jgi:hypothetical protein
MVQIVQLPVAWSMTNQQHFMMEHEGKLEEVKAARLKESEEARAELAQHLSDGYTLLSTVTLEVTSRTFIVYTLFKQP